MPLPHITLSPLHPTATSPRPTHSRSPSRSPTPSPTQLTGLIRKTHHRSSTTLSLPASLQNFSATAPINSSPRSSIPLALPPQNTNILSSDNSKDVFSILPESPTFPLPSGINEERTKRQITVALRIRPLNANELCGTDKAIEESDVDVDNRVGVIGVEYDNLSGPNTGASPTISLLDYKHFAAKSQGDILSRDKSGRFHFDHTYTPHHSNEKIARELCPGMISSVLRGRHATLFAYGASGAGKTHTISGVQTNERRSPGIIYYLTSDLFTAVRLREDEEGTSTKITATYVEIYCEQLRDLLSDDSMKRTSLTLQESKTNGVTVNGLSQWALSSEEEVEVLLARGLKNRTVDSHLLNATSSRSHAILTLFVSSYSKTGSLLHPPAQLCVIDLAGSERAKKSGTNQKMLREGAKINQSLLALSTCISLLSSDSTSAKHHIPYRDSKLTRMLKESLSGQTLTVLLACVSPSVSQWEETRETLFYASKAKQMKKTQPVQKNVDLTTQQWEAICNELKQEIFKMKNQIQSQDNLIQQLTSQKPILPENARVSSECVDACISTEPDPSITVDIAIQTEWTSTHDEASQTESQLSLSQIEWIPIELDSVEAENTYSQVDNENVHEQCDADKNDRFYQLVDSFASMFRLQLELGSQLRSNSSQFSTDDVGELGLLQEINKLNEYIESARRICEEACAELETSLRDCSFTKQCYFQMKVEECYRQHLQDIIEQKEKQHHLEVEYYKKLLSSKKVKYQPFIPVSVISSYVPAPILSRLKKFDVDANHLDISIWNGSLRSTRFFDDDHLHLPRVQLHPIPEAPPITPSLFSFRRPTLKHIVPECRENQTGFTFAIPKLRHVEINAHKKRLQLDEDKPSPSSTTLPSNEDIDKMTNLVTFSFPASNTTSPFPLTSWADKVKSSLSSSTNSSHNSSLSHTPRETLPTRIPTHNRSRSTFETRNTSSSSNSGRNRSRPLPAPSGTRQDMQFTAKFSQLNQEWGAYSREVGQRKVRRTKSIAHLYEHPVTQQS